MGNSILFFVSRSEASVWTGLSLTHSLSHSLTTFFYVCFISSKISAIELSLCYKNVSMLNMFAFDAFYSLSLIQSENHATMDSLSLFFFLTVFVLCIKRPQLVSVILFIRYLFMLILSKKSGYIKTDEAPWTYSIFTVQHITKELLS